MSGRLYDLLIVRVTQARGHGGNLVRDGIKLRLVYEHASDTSLQTSVCQDCSYALRGTYVRSAEGGSGGGSGGGGGGNGSGSGGCSSGSGDKWAINSEEVSHYILKFNNYFLIY